MNDKKILILGGGFAGARMAQELSKAGFSNVSLIDRKEYFEVTYSTLRTLADPAFGQKGRVKYSDFLKGSFHKGEVVELGEHNAKLADGTDVPFDVAVVATGSSYRSFPVAKSIDALSLKDRENEISNEHARLVAASSVLILGGGAVGVELAGEIADQFPDKQVTLAEAGDRLLGALKPKASQVAERQLSKLGVKVLTSTRLAPEDSDYKDADVVYMCTGLVPNTGFMRANFASCMDQSGRLKVNSEMKIAGSDHIFAIGDCSDTPPIKFGYVADIQGDLLAKNFKAIADGKVGKPYKPQSIMSLIPTGRSKGLAQLPFGVTTLGLFVNMKQKDMFISRVFKTLGIERG